MKFEEKQSISLPERDIFLHNLQSLKYIIDLQYKLTTSGNFTWQSTPFYVS